MMHFFREFGAEFIIQSEARPSGNNSQFVAGCLTQF